MEAKNAEQRKTLSYLLLINATMFVIELAAGILANSTALMADSLDMLADAGVYGISLYVVGRSPLDKIRAAFLSGIFQMTLAGLVLFDVIRKFFASSDPQSILMMGIGAVALVANIAGLWLVAKHREGGVHMRASWIFSKNDVIANIGVIVSGWLVTLLQSPLPDLIIGLAIVTLVFRGSVRILKAVRVERAKYRHF